MYEYASAEWVLNTLPIMENKSLQKVTMVIPHDVFPSPKAAVQADH